MADADLKVTKIVIKVNLKCFECYKKIKRVLCRYPEIRDQTYDEKNNKVFITVVCCSPKCIMEKIICKAGDTVESIEIVPDKPEPEKPKKDKPPKPEKKKIVIILPSNPPTPGPGPLPKATEPLAQVIMQQPQQGPVPMYPIGVCCCCCRGGPPCYHGREPTCYDGCGRPAYECQGRNRGYNMSHCDEYFSEENASGCSVM